MFKFIWQLSLFHNRLTNMPYSIPLFWGIIAANFSLLFLLISIATTSLLSGVVKTIILMGVISLFTFLILKLYRLDKSFIITLSALLATLSLIVCLFGLPYILIYLFLLNTDSNLIYYLGLVIAWLLLLIGSTWLFAIFSRIYQEALAFDLNRALFATLILMFIIMSIFLSLRIIGI